MIVMFRIHIKVLYPLFFFFLLNCQLKESSNTHGILFLENRNNKLIINKTNKNDVINIIGHPHSESIDSDNEWIYIERVYNKGEFHKLGQNVLKSNNVLFLEFNRFGILKNKKLFNKEDLKKITFSDKETENDLSKRSFVDKLFSSLKAKMYGRR